MELDSNSNIPNEKLKNVFSGENLKRVKSFIDETQVLAYYYGKNRQELIEFQNDVKKVFQIVENKVKASL